MIDLAAGLFVVLALFVVAFQVALILGAPWGHLTLGGRFEGALPRRVRAVPAVSALLLGGFAIVVLARAGLALPGWSEAARVAIWVPVAYLVLGSVANAATPSRDERRLWLPVILVMLVCALVVALAA